MAIDEGLLDLLVCPETREKLAMAEGVLLAQLVGRRERPARGLGVRRERLHAAGADGTAG